MSKLGQLRTCFILTTTRQNSCLSPPLEPSISITYLLQSLLAMLKLPSVCKKLVFALDCHLTMNTHVSTIALTCYFELCRLPPIHRLQTSTATTIIVSAFALSRIDYCNSLLFGSTHDVTSHLQRMKNYAARVIFRLQKSSNIVIYLRSLHWLPVKVEANTKWLVCDTSVTAVLHHHMSLTSCRKSHHIPATLAPAHAACLFSIDLHTVRRLSVAARFLLLLPMSGTLFQMMSGVPHHCHHLSLV